MLKLLGKTLFGVWRSSDDPLSGCREPRPVNASGLVMTKSVVYILKDDKGTYYIGSTIDIERRLRQPQSGHTHSTHRMTNPRLVFSQQFSTINKARSIEKKIKS
ncbi:hypothetical protein BH23PAT2_BH23PAT2_02780 [soil metagenome]